MNTYTIPVYSYSFFEFRCGFGFYERACISQNFTIPVFSDIDFHAHFMYEFLFTIFGNTEYCGVDGFSL